MQNQNGHSFKAVIFIYIYIYILAIELKNIIIYHGRRISPKTDLIIDICFLYVAP